MKSFAIRLAVLLLPAFVVIAAGQSRAEMWCGNGPGTALSHPCTDDDDSDNQAVSDAIAKHQDRWMRIDGVWSVDEGDTYHNRAATIVIHVEPPHIASVRKQIPTSIDGIPVVIVPGKMPEDDTSMSFFSSDPAQNARRVRRAEARAKAEESYNEVVQRYGDRWEDLPGVLGVGAASDRDGCDFRTIEVTVQRELLSKVRNEIPPSVNGVRIVLTPEE